MTLTLPLSDPHPVNTLHQGVHPLKVVSHHLLVPHQDRDKDSSTANKVSLASKEVMEDTTNNL